MGARKGTSFVMHASRRCSFLVFCLVMGLGFPFSYVSRPISRPFLSQTEIKKRKQGCLNTMQVAKTDGASGGAATLKDAEGNEIVEGMVVRVAVGSLKAYHVPPKGQGTFDENKDFSRAPEGGERGTKNLAIPVGLRGVVTKVYDVSDISANLPVRVKFAPGKHVDEGYDAPVAFIMHFGAREIECVEETDQS